MSNAQNGPTLTEQESSGAAGRTHLSYDAEGRQRRVDRTNPARELPDEDENLTEYDKIVADSFPASDPPAHP